MGRSLEGSRHSSQGSSPWTHMGLMPPALNGDSTCEMRSAREAHGGSMLRILLGTGHTGIICLVCAKPSDSRRNAGVQHRLYFLHKLFSHSEPLLLQNDGSPPKPQVPRCQPRAHQANRCFLANCPGPAVLTLLHRRCYYHIPILQKLRGRVGHWQS